MSQERQGYAHRGEIQSVIPKASTSLSSGDYVVMPRNIDPISRAVLGAESRISPAAAAYTCQWGIGLVDSDFTTDTVGATLYATPTAKEALPVIRKGVVRLAIVQTSGQAGDLVIYSSGGTGAQLFSLNSYRRDVAIGRIYQTFSGATANDVQQVELIEKPISEKDIYFWLGNGIVQGCKARKHSANAFASTEIQMGGTGEVNLVMIKGKLQSVAKMESLTIGSVNPGGPSALRFYWLAAKISTAGSNVDWTFETCTGPFSAFQSWTNSGISKGMMIPITWTSNMVPVGMVIGWSVTQVTISDRRIFNMGYGGQIPFGNKNIDHTKWYL